MGVRRKNLRRPPARVRRRDFSGRSSAGGRQIFRRRVRRRDFSPAGGQVFRGRRQKVLLCLHSPLCLCGSAGRRRMEAYLFLLFGLERSNGRILGATYVVNFGPLTFSPPSLQQLAQDALGVDNEILLPLLIEEWGMPKDGCLAKLFSSISTSAYNYNWSNYADVYYTPAQKRLEAVKSPLLLELIESRIRSQFLDLSEPMQNVACGGHVCLKEPDLPIPQLLQDLPIRVGANNIFSWDASGWQLEHRWDKILASDSWKSFGRAHWHCALRYLEELLSRHEILRRH